MNGEFVPFKKIPRLSRDIIITEKIDGTNGVIYNGPNCEFLVGSRSRWLCRGNDNYGFWEWANRNREELTALGPGFHYGEWWGKGIQRGYGVEDKRFSLFNSSKWNEWSPRPYCCLVVPVLYVGPFDTNTITSVLDKLKEFGSVASPGFMKPEGIVIYHTQGNVYFKKTIEKDEKPKGEIGE
jgi:hypothetical protein